MEEEFPIEINLVIAAGIMEYNDLFRQLSIPFAIVFGDFEEENSHFLKLILQLTVVVD